MKRVLHVEGIVGDCTPHFNPDTQQKKPLREYRIYVTIQHRQCVYNMRGVRATTGTWEIQWVFNILRVCLQP